MNNAFNYQNDLTGFRSQLSEITKNHDNAVANAAAVAIGTKSRLIQKAKDLKEAGDSLVKQGLEAEIVPTAGAAIFKGGKALYGKIASKLGNAADDVAETGGNSIESISSSAGNEGASTITQSGRVTRIARPSNPNTNEEFRRGQGQEMRSRELDDVEDERPFIDETPDPYGRQPTEGTANNTGADAPQTDTDGGNIRSRVGEAEGDVEQAAGDVGEDAGNALSQAVSGASDAAEAAASGAADAASGLASGAADLAGAAASGASDLASGIAGAASGLEEAAAATSWIPFVGEVMGGVAAAAALGAAGYGAYEEIKGAIQEGAADATKIMPKPVAPADVAGSFIAPQQSSQES